MKNTIFFNQFKRFLTLVLTFKNQIMGATAAVFMFISTPLLAEVYLFTGTGNWSDATKWSPSVPPPNSAGDAIFISCGSACTLTGGINQILGQKTVLIIEPSSQVILELSNSLLVGVGSRLINLGTIQIKGDMTVATTDFDNSKGILQPNASGNLNFTGISTLNGTLNWENGGDMTIESGAMLTVNTELSIYPLTTLLIETNGTLIANQGIFNTSGSGSAIFHNKGHFVHYSNFQTETDDGFPFINDGVIDSYGAVLANGAGPFNNTGSWNVHAGIKAVFTGEVMNTGTITIDGTYFSTYSGKISGNGTINLNGSLEYAPIFITGRLPSGTFNWNDGATIKLTQFATQTLLIDKNLTLEGNRQFILDPGRKVQIEPNIAFILKKDLVITNNSQFTVSSGGNLAINSGATVTINTGAVLTNNGTVVNNGNIAQTGTYSNNGIYKGSGAFTGAFQNTASGIVSVGNSAGCHSFNTGFNNAGKVLMELGGTTACTQHDLINVTQTATLGGTLEIVLLNGFHPSAGQVFTLLKADAISGTFSTVILPTAVTASVNYTATEVQLVVSAVLPVGLIDFSGQNTEGGNLLQWKTEEEKNTSHFDIERSPNGQFFTKISEEKAKGTNAIYQFLDAQPSSGLNYYRLKINDFDGKLDYSKIITLSNSVKKQMKIYPNPVTDFITIENVEGEKIEIVNALGQVVRTLHTDGIRDAKWKVPVAHLPNGLYIAKTEKQAIQFVKN